MFFQMAPKGPSWGRTFVFGTGGEVLILYTNHVPNTGAWVTIVVTRAARLFPTFRKQSQKTEYNSKLC
jgi:hypothetical protein